MGRSLTHTHKDTQTLTHLQTHSIQKRHSPTKPFEEDVIALSAMFDAPQYSHRSVRIDVVVKLNGVQVLHSDPSEDGSGFFHICDAASDQQSNQIGKRLLVFTSHLLVETEIN